VAWIEEVGCEPGRTIWCAFEEIGVRGWATVLAVEPCPPIKPGPGRVVLATMTSMAREVLRLEVRGRAEPIEVTARHRLFSADRRAWVSAGDLLLGEQLKTRRGSVAVERLELRPGARRVYNLEVEREHCYHVSRAEILAHNESGDAEGTGGEGGGAYAERTDVPEIDRPLPRDRHGGPIPDVDAPHSQIGRNRDGEPVAREWMHDESGRLQATRDIEFTDHGTPGVPGHHNPHQHILIPNNPSVGPSAGYQRSPAQPLRIP
jgi:hypothetical protein